MILLCPVSLPTPRASTSQAADDATKAGATAEVKERRTFLRVAEAGLIAAHRPVTLLLPAATIILVLREASRWLELLVDLHDDYLPRFKAGHTGVFVTPRVTSCADVYPFAGGPARRPPAPLCRHVTSACSSSLFVSGSKGTTRCTAAGGAGRPARRPLCSTGGQLGGHRGVVLPKC